MICTHTGKSGEEMRLAQCSVPPYKLNRKTHVEPASVGHEVVHEVAFDDHRLRDQPKTMTTISKMKLPASHVALHEIMHEVANSHNCLVGLRIIHGNPDSI